MNKHSHTSARTTLILLFAINFLNFFDRTMPAVVLEPIRKEFDLDDTMLGLVGTVFTLIYAVAGLPLGRLADRVARKHVLSAGVFVWSLMTAASGVAWNLVSFLLIRVGVGVGEASCAPAANSLIADLYPSSARARAMGVFMLGLPLGSLACFSIGGYWAQQYGWRAPFFFAAVPGLLVCCALFFLHEPARGSQEAYQVDCHAPIENPYRRIIATPTLWWIILSGTSVHFASYAMVTFLPAFLVRFHHLSVGQAGGVCAIVLGLTGVVGLTAGGWLADRIHQAYRRGRLLLGAACLIGSAPLLWMGFGFSAGSTVLLTMLLAIAWLMYFMYFVTVYPSIPDIIEPRLRGTAMALYFFFQYVLGAGFGTLVTGALSDHYAKAAMSAAGATAMIDSYRALGLQSALGLVLPLAVLVTGVALVFASRSFVADSTRVAVGAQPALA